MRAFVLPDQKFPNCSKMGKIKHIIAVSGYLQRAQSKTESKTEKPRVMWLRGHRCRETPYSTNHLRAIEDAEHIRLYDTKP